MALVNRDVEAARAAIAFDREVDQREKEIESPEEAEKRAPKRGALFPHHRGKNVRMKRGEHRKGAIFPVCSAIQLFQGAGFGDGLPNLRPQRKHRRG